MLHALGAAVARHRRAVLAAWALAAAAGALAAGGVFDRAETLDSRRPDAPSALAEARIDELRPEGEQVVAVLSGRTFRATDLVDDASRVMYEVRAIPGVVAVQDAYTTPVAIVSDDELSTLVRVELDPALDEAGALAVADRVAAALRTIDVPVVLVGGELLAERDFAEQALADAARGETVAVALLVVLLTMVLGGLVAGLLPLVAGLGAVTATLLALAGVVSVAPVSEYAVNVVTLLGLGLGVDYGLLLVFRFREERAGDPGADLPELVGRTVAGAGRAVLVSGLAVGTALAGLFLFAEPVLASMAAGGVVVVAMATVAGLTLVPALLAVAHRRVPEQGQRTWVRRGRVRHRSPAPPVPLVARAAALAQRRPARVAALATAGLLVLAAPVAGIRLANSDARGLPPGSESRQAYEAVEDLFAPGRTAPMQVLVERDVADPEVARAAAEIRGLPGAAAVDVEPDMPPGATVLEVSPDGTASSDTALSLLAGLRALEPPVQVAGPTAELADARASVAQRLPVAVAVVAAATFALLLALTGSVLVGVKALVLNALTLLATAGVLVAVFQWGWGAGLLGVQPWGALDITTPVLLFVFVFGLSMDYEVFLLSRITEAWDRRTASDAAASDRAVLAGITASGPVVVAAAAAIGVVFLGFAFGELVAVKEIGVGMAVAVLLDVTVVRGLLLPALMSLLGRWNWWPGLFRPAAPPPPAPGPPGLPSPAHRPGRQVAAVPGG